MQSRLLLLVVPVMCLCFLAVTLYLNGDGLEALRFEAPDFWAAEAKKGVSEGNWAEADWEEATPSPTSIPTPTPTPTPQDSVASTPGVQDGKVLPAADIKQYIKAITNTNSTALPRLHCRAVTETRYNGLTSANSEIQYLFAIDLRQVVSLLPRLIGSVVEAIRFLGVNHCALSIVEGNSNDGTDDVLNALESALKDLGIKYFFQRSDINPGHADRINRLAQLRNLPLTPLMELENLASDPTVIFLNDVAICANDILELIHQKSHIGADMTCAMDWTYAGRDPTFYDVWVSRAINGDTFFDIPKDGSWDSAWNLFWNHPLSQMRLRARRPFQVFACWNGAVAFTAKPLLGDGGLRFRAKDEKTKECFQGEPQLFCKDMWFRGYGKIAVVPSINLEYSNEKGEKIKEAKGWTADNVKAQDPEDDMIEWQLEPPDETKCMPTWDNQFWQAWDTGL